MSASLIPPCAAEPAACRALAAVLDGDLIGCHRRTETTFVLVALDRTALEAICACGAHDGREPDADAEPSLGWSETAMRGCHRYGLALDADQSRLGAGTGDDREWCACEAGEPEDEV